jgi:hypothetical protein
MKQDQKQPELPPRADQAKPEQAEQKAPESQSSAPAQPPQRAAPGRRPLFGN